VGGPSRGGPGRFSVRKKARPDGNQPNFFRRFADPTTTRSSVVSTCVNYAVLHAFKMHEERRSYAEHRSVCCCAVLARVHTDSGEATHARRHLIFIGETCLRTAKETHRRLFRLGMFVIAIVLLGFVVEHPHFSRAR